jgi:trk system potassium uptake protein TrkA
MKVIIVGGGQTGLALANLLVESNDITIIEKEEAVAKEAANRTSALLVKGDATDVSVLKQAGIEEADALVVVTSDDKTNLMICEIAKSEKVKRIISLVNSPANEELFTKLKINRLVSVVGTNITAIKKMLHQVGEERIIAQLGAGEVQLIELAVSKDSKLKGKSAKIKNAVIATIYRSGELIIPTESTELKAGDVLLVAVKTKDLSKVAKIISKK